MAQKASATMHSTGSVKLHVPDPDRKTTSSKGHTAPPHVTDEDVCMSTTPSPLPTHDTDTGIVLVCKSAPLEDHKFKKSTNYSKERLVLTIPSPPLQHQVAFEHDSFSAACKYSKGLNSSICKLHFLKKKAFFFF